MGTLWAAAASRRTNLAVLFRGTSPVSILHKSLVRERGDDWSLAYGWKIQYVLKGVVCIRYSVAARSFWSGMQASYPLRQSVLSIPNVKTMQRAGTVAVPATPFCDILTCARWRCTIDTNTTFDCNRTPRERHRPSAGCIHLHTALFQFHNHTDLKRDENMSYSEGSDSDSTSRTRDVRFSKPR
jgi:hypothetical protein